MLFRSRIGDEVLTLVGKTITNLLRRMDVVARWGGEEFVIILQNVTPDYLQLAAERVRRFIERSFLMLDGEELSVTASLGATVVRGDDTFETIVDRADKLMYESKNKGRNKLTCG